MSSAGELAGPLPALGVAAALLLAGCSALVEDLDEPREFVRELAPTDGPSNRWARKMIQATALHDRGIVGRNVTVAVVDTGVRDEHPEFRGAGILWADVVNQREDPYDNNGHGTHVSGLAVSRPDAGLEGIVGAAPGAQLMHIKAVPSDGSASADKVEKAIRAATRQGADVIVLSLGQKARVVDPTRGMEDAVRDAIEKGVVVVAAAGNAQQGESGENCKVTSPANLRRVIAVGAVDRHKSIAHFSCSGPEEGPAGLQQNEDPHRKPELTAPGVRMAGPWPSRPCAGKADASYCLLSGTSQATPMVGGVVALLLAEHPDLQRRDADAVVKIKKALTRTAEKVGFSGHHDRYGYGIAQAEAALAWLDSG